MGKVLTSEQFNAEYKKLRDELDEKKGEINNLVLDFIHGSRVKLGDIVTIVETEEDVKVAGLTIKDPYGGEKKEVAISRCYRKKKDGEFLKKQSLVQGKVRLSDGTVMEAVFYDPIIYLGDDGVKEIVNTGMAFRRGGVFLYY